MQTQTFSEQALIEMINRLPPERVSEVADFVEFLTEREEKAQDAADVAEVQRRQANIEPAQRRTLDHLRQANGQHSISRTQRTSAERAHSFREWANGHSDLPTLPQEAFHRSSFYEERG